MAKQGTIHLPKVKAGDVAGYLFLPRVFPRMEKLFTSGFGYFAFLIASVYQAVKILPNHHPYCNPANIGKFGVRQVIMAAADNIKFTTKNIDQIIAFFGIIAGVMLLVCQFIGLFLMMITNVAYAGPFAGIFNTPTPETDIAFLMLDHVFGIPDFFGSNLNAAPGLPMPFHNGLHSLFQFYNYALLVVAVLIFLYYVVVVIAETATSGTPFGKRFAHVYAPLRLVAAVGLLVPLNYGFNASQYITLVAARMGSGLATNGWIVYNRGLENVMGVQTNLLLAKPQNPEIDELVAFMTVVHSCKEAHCLGQAAPAGTPACPVANESGPGKEILPYLVKSEQQVEFAGSDYQAAKAFFTNGDIIVTFGHLSADQYPGEPGNVQPTCGRLTIPVGVHDGQDTRGVQAENIQEFYFNLVQYLWVSPLTNAIGERFARAKLMPQSSPDAQSVCWEAGIIGDGGTCNRADGLRYKPPPDAKNTMVSTAQAIVNANILAEFATSRATLNLAISDEILARGWGGAGIAYNDLADINGKFFNAVFNVPQSRTYPMLMEEVQEFRQKQNQAGNNLNRYNPNLAEGESIPNMEEGGRLRLAEAMNETYQYWAEDEVTNEAQLTGNIFFDTISRLFGAYGLFCMIDPFPGPQGATDDFREGCDPEGTHPIVQLIALGKSIVDAAIRNLAWSMGFALGGGIFDGHWVGGTAQAMSGFFLSIASIGLGIGFTLYYVIPFLPFLYFFFAVGAWVKTIFEAMVGAPLWALAHLRIDGEGFPGSSASNGYVLILEIMIRPILTVFGLVGGFAIFTALAHILHEIFSLVIVNLSGYEAVTGAGPNVGAFAQIDGLVENLRRNIIDEFFYTIIYTIIIYMMAIASFKFIDMVPNFITRWLGQQISSFADMAKNTEELESAPQYAMIGGGMIGGQLGGALTSAARGTGQVGRGLFEMAGGGGGGDETPSPSPTPSPGPSSPSGDPDANDPRNQ